MMENWVFLALLAPLFFSMSNITDKLALAHIVDGYLEYMFFAGLGGGILYFCLLIGGLITPIAAGDILLCLLAGILTYFLYFFYSLALEEMEVSAASALHQIEPLFILIIEFIVYQMFISGQEMLAFFIILVCGILLTTRLRDLLRLRVDRNFYLLLLSTLFGALATIILDQVLTRVDLWTTAGYQFAGYALTSLSMLLVPKCRIELIQAFRRASLKKFGVFVLNDVFDMTGYLIFMQALALAPSAATVSVLITVEPIYVLIIATLLARFNSDLIDESASMREFSRKGIFMVGIIVGIYLLY